MKEDAAMQYTIPTTIYLESAVALYNRSKAELADKSNESFWKGALKVWKRFAEMTPDEFNQWNTTTLGKKARKLHDTARSDYTRGQEHAYNMLSIHCCIRSFD
jgi:hypothetical protein